MKTIRYCLMLTILIASLILAGSALAQDNGPQVADDKPITEEKAPELLATGAGQGGISAVSTYYNFASPSGTYTEITGGTILCTGTGANCDDDNFNALNLGFTFRFHGVDYTQVSVQNNGFIAMGPAVVNSYTPISTGTSNNIVVAMGMDLQALTGGVLRYELLGASPDQVFVIQWKDYKYYGTGGAGDIFNFQIRLYETSNKVEVVYGAFTKNATARTPQIGLRGASSADFNNRMTDTTHFWANSLAGTANTSTMALSQTVLPTSGQIYEWTHTVSPDFNTSTKSAPTSVLVGDLITYTAYIANTGDLTATAAVLTDPLPTGTSFVSGTLACSAGTCTFSELDNAVYWNGALNIGASARITFTVETDTAPCGELVNTYTLTDPALITPVQKSARTTVIYVAPILQQSFDDATFPPADWGTTDVTGTTTTDWTRELVGTSPAINPHSGAAMARYNSYSITAGNSTRLFTSVLDFSGMTAPTLRFWMSHDNAYAPNNDRIQVQVSTDGGATYASIGRPILRADLTCTTPCWKEHTVDLSAYIGQANVRIGFLGVGQYGTNIFLDDVTVGEAWSPCPSITLGSDQTQQGCQGTNTTINYTLVNRQNQIDTIALSLTSGAWTANVVPSSVTLGPNASAVVTVTVDVPVSAVLGDTSAVTLNAFGAILSDSAVVTTQAAERLVYKEFAYGVYNRFTRDHAVVYYNGKIYKIGGYDGAARGYLDIYDIATDRWSIGAPMPDVRYWIDCVEIEGKIYCAGGYSTAGQSTLYIYDPALNSWTTGAALPAARYAYAGVAYGGYYYVIGGYTTLVTNSVLRYDPLANSWITLANNMNVARRYPAAGVMGGMIYVAGGFTGSAAINTAEVYDPVGGTWTYVANLPATIPGGTPITGWLRSADAVLDNRFLFMLGGGYLDSQASMLALVYDSQTDTWRWVDYLPRMIYSAEADSDGVNIWLSSGRVSENGTFGYSRYMTRIRQCENADLSCIKTDAVDPVPVGELVTYNVNVANLGHNNAQNVVLNDTLPAGSTFAYALPGAPDCTEALGVLTCNLGDLPAGGAIDVTVVITAPGTAGTITNTATVSADQIDTELGNNIAHEDTLVTFASIALAKTVGTDPNVCATTDAISVLDFTTVTYCYRVQNTGAITFTLHDLADSELGALLTSFPHALGPGDSTFYTTTAVITQTTINTATWTANDGSIFTSASDSATVHVVPATITMAKTVGTDPLTCAATDNIAVPVGTDVTYCYEVTNTSPSAYFTHTLVDDQLGLLLNDFPYDLAPGASFFVTQTTHILTNTTNTAVWTATDGFHTASFNDTATVRVVEVLPGCGLPLEDFNAGTAGFPPVGWTVVNNGGTHVWESSETTGYANNTGGTGFFADANSDWAGSGYSLNTELRTPFFSLAGAPIPVLTYRYDYYDIGGADTGKVDISTDGGATWTNLQTYLVSDRGPKQALIDLSAYAGEPFVQIRFTYMDSGWDWWFQVDDVETMCNAEPEIDVTPTAISVTMLINTTGSQLLTIDNLGYSALNWEADEGCGAPVDWLALADPISGTIPGAGTHDLTVNFDNTGLPTGQYVSSVCIASNDADEPVVAVPVTMNVVGQPVISLAPDALNAAQYPDVQSTQVFTIANSGNVNLDWLVREANLAFEAPNRAPEDIGVAWETMAPMPAGRVFNAVIADENGYVYVLGGTSDAGGTTPTSSNYRYNTATNVWDTMAPIPTLMYQIDGFVINNMLYIPGDSGTATTYVYDIAANTWSSITANGGYTARGQYQVVAIGADLYVLGGIAGTASTTEVWILDTTTGIWSAGVPMLKSRTSFAAAAIGDQIYVAGGVLYPGFTPDMTAEKFDGTAWSYVAPVPNGGGTYTRWSYNADGRGADGLWLAAGRRDAGWAVLNHAGYYNPVTDTWTDSPTIPMLAQGRVYMEGDVATDGFFYVIGGRDPAGAIIYTTNERLQVGLPTCVPSDLPWLTVDPLFGTVTPGGANPVQVTFDSTGLSAGDYTGSICVASNDPVNPELSVPVTLTVNALPEVTFVFNDLEDVVAAGEHIWIIGDFTDWLNNPITMTANADSSIFTATAGIPAGSYGYKFFTPDLPDWSNYDMLNTANRTLDVSGDMTVDAYRSVSVGWSHLSDPVAVTITLGENSGNLGGEVYIQNVTTPAGEGRGVAAQFGYGADPDPATWTWVDMTYAGDNGNNDLFTVVITPTAVGAYTYGVRFDGNWGVGNPNMGWTNGDRTGLLTVEPVVIAPEADLALTKSASTESVMIGGSVVYTLTVENLGPDDATGVVLTDNLPAGVSVVDLPVGCVETSGAVVCDLGNIANGDSVIVVIVVTAPETAGTLTNTARVASNETDPNSANNTASVVVEVFGMKIHLPIVFKLFP